MIITQKFNVVPQGYIQKGSVGFSANTVTGEITADEDILAGVFIFTKTIQESGSYKIDPSMLLSANIKIGMKLVAGPLSVTVISVVNNVATLHVVIDDAADEIQMTGSAHLDLESEYWEITDVVVTGQADGYGVTIQLESAF